MNEAGREEKVRISREWVACSHDAKRRVSMKIAMAASMPTHGYAV